MKGATGVSNAVGANVEKERLTLQAEIEFKDANIVEAINNLTQTLSEILTEFKSWKRSDFGEWLNATNFCKKYNISRPTLDKLVKKGLIEVNNFGGDVKRYRAMIRKEN